MSSGKPDVFAVVSKDEVLEGILKRRRLNSSTASTAASTIPAASVSAGAAASISAAAAPLPSPPASDATRPTPQSKGYQRIENAQYPAIQHGYHQKHMVEDEAEEDDGLDYEAEEARHEQRDITMRN